MKLSAAWNSFLSLRTITTIINILKFLIVIAITLVKNYPSTAGQIKDSQIAVGSIGIACWNFGYLFYIFLCTHYL